MHTQLELIEKGATAEVFQWEEGKILYFKRRIYNSYIKEYQKQTGCILKDIKMWEPPIAAARLAEKRPPEEEACLLKMVQKQLLVKDIV